MSGMIFHCSHLITITKLLLRQRATQSKYGTLQQAIYYKLLRIGVAIIHQHSVVIVQALF